MSEAEAFKQFRSDYKLDGFSFSSIETEKYKGKWQKKIDWGGVRWVKNKNSEVKDIHKAFAIRTGKASNIVISLVLMKDIVGKHAL